MTVSTNPRLITLSDLRHSFGLMLDENNPFFTQWLNHFLPLDEAEQQAIDRLARNYTYLSYEDSPLEEVVKLVVVSPLLDLAGFYQHPFGIKTEGSTRLELADDGVIIQGKIDILVVQEFFWIVVIESKPGQIDITVGIPQLLNYLLSAPQTSKNLFGMVTNGREVVFVYLDRGQSLSTYSRSSTYRLLENNLERTQVLQGLKYLSRRFLEEGPME